MSTVSLMPNKQIQGIKPGNFVGNMWDSWNIDLERQPGRIKLSNKLRQDSTIGLVTKFVRTNADNTSQWWGLEHDSNLNKNGDNDLDGGTWAADTETNTPTDCKDMIVHEAANGEERLVVTRATDIAILNHASDANDWIASYWQTTLSQTALTSQTFHPLATLQRLLAIGDVQSNNGVIHTIDKDDIVQFSRLTFPERFTPRISMSSSDRFWFGLQHNQSGGARIIEWDGFSLTYNDEYDLTGDYPLTGWVWNNIPYYIDDLGIIYRYSGGSFIPVNSFNLNEDRQIFNQSTSSTRTIMPYGSYVSGNLVYILVGMPLRNTSADTDGIHRGRSGIWIYNLVTNNLYHHKGVGQHASAGTDVDYGHPHIDQVGAMIVDHKANNALVFCSASVHTGGTNFGTTNVQALFGEVESSDQASNAGRNRGWIAFTYKPTGDIESMFEGVWIKFKRFVNSNNRIIVKWRTVDQPRDQDANDNSPLQAQATWASTTTFTCIVPTGVAVDDEVEVLTGDNGGQLYNISSFSAIPDGSTTITVTIDETAITDSTDTFLARFANWQTESAITTTTRGSQFVPFTSSTTTTAGANRGEWIQIKLELRGFDLDIDDVILKWKTLTASNQA